MKFSVLDCSSLLLDLIFPFTFSSARKGSSVMSYQVYSSSLGWARLLLKSLSLYFPVGYCNFLIYSDPYLAFVPVIKLFLFSVSVSRKEIYFLESNLFRVKRNLR